MLTATLSSDFLTESRARCAWRAVVTANSIFTDTQKPNHIVLRVTPFQQYCHRVACLSIKTAHRPLTAKPFGKADAPSGTSHGADIATQLACNRRVRQTSQLVDGNEDKFAVAHLECRMVAPARA